MGNQQAIEQELERLDDLIDKWHEGGSGVPLSAFLGMEPDEYILYVTEPEQYAAARLRVQE